MRLYLIVQQLVVEALLVDILTFPLGLLNLISLNARSKFESDCAYGGGQSSSNVPIVDGLLTLR